MDKYKKGTGDKKLFILRKSNKKNKRFDIIMDDHMHSFASATGKTFIDHQDEKKKEAWIARHKGDKNYNKFHSGIHTARKLLWTEPKLKDAIKKYEKEHNVKIKVEI